MSDVGNKSGGLRQAISAIVGVLPAVPALRGLRALLSGTPSARPPRPDVLRTEDAFHEELYEIESRRRHSGAPPAPPGNPVGETCTQRATRLRLTALCLSGGGIRSAAFCLGVIQSLAAKRLLNEFDYLSTVSGGGFIGGWLQMLLRQPGVGQLTPNVGTVQQQLGDSGAIPVRKLRAFTNYLTPQTGPFSTDTWAGIALYLRNFLLNWMVFAPLFLLLALVPIFYRTAMRSLCDSGWLIAVLLVLAGMALAGAAWQACTLLPSHSAANPSAFATSKAIIWRIMTPALVWAWLVPAVIEYGMARRRILGSDYAGWPGQWAIPAVYLVAMLAGFWIAWWWHGDRDDRARALYGTNHRRWIIATSCAAALIWIGLHLIRPDGSWYKWVREALLMTDPKSLVGPKPLVDRETILAVLFPLWLIGTYLLQTTFYVGFRKEGLLADLDREWLARLNGAMLRIGVVWTLFALCCLALPRLVYVLNSGGSMGGHQLAIIASGTTVFGSIAAWLGRKLSAGIETIAKASNRWEGLLLTGLSLLFAVGLLVVAGTLLQYGLGKVQDQLFGTHVSLLKPLLLQFVLAALLVGLIYCFGRVNVNRFSMHATYRNRLSRAFLGAARAQRQFDPFTGFDQRDNPRLAKFSAATAKQRLFPVINMTLNVTAGKDAAWAERKAESFVATPLLCGGAALKHPEQPDGDAPGGAFVHTTEYAGMESRGDMRGETKGPRIGSMLTISGAAASPNWGYRSSPATAFLMTLFNFRLGAWLPNPAVATKEELQLAKPSNSIMALMYELMGKTTDTRQSIYLSDGGHFENLGLYEMLRRRCRRIVLVDAGQDQDCTFFDLGNAIRKAAIDFDVQVAMRPMHIYSREKLEQDKTPPTDALGFAMGDITYPGSTEKGVLLYLKPSFLPDIPAEVRAYGRTDTSFPHDSTLEQWFTESQFESYRALGAWQMAQITDAVPVHAPPSLDDLFDAAKRLCGRASGKGMPRGAWPCPPGPVSAVARRSMQRRRELGQ
jgi:hypothetical protein